MCFSYVHVIREITQKSNVILENLKILPVMRDPDPPFQTLKKIKSKTTAKMAFSFIFILLLNGDIDLFVFNIRKQMFERLLAVHPEVYNMFSSFFFYRKLCRFNRVIGNFKNKEND